MEPARQKWIARLILVAIIGAGVGWLAQVDYGRKVSTDVLDLIPTSERAPELLLARTLADQQQARVALFVLQSSDEARLADATDAFVTALRGSPAFAEVVRMPDATGRDALGRFVFQRRFDLLLPAWLAARHRDYETNGLGARWPDWLAEHAAANLEHFIGTPEAVGFQDLLPSDPLLLVADLAERTRALELETPNQAGQQLVWARTSAPPLSEAAQQPVFAAVDSALQSARGICPSAALRWTSVGRFAAENRERIQGELSWLNGVSLVAVLGVAFVCLQRVRKALHLVPVVLGALLGAWVVTTLVFARVHVLVFVVGSLLGGVAIDYGFYLFLQPPAFPGEPYLGKVRRLLKPLLASAFTTILGFSLLLWSDLPLIRQLGVFVSAGLIAALLTALLWFAQRDETYTPTRAFARRRLAATSRAQRVARLLLAAGAIIALGGLLRLHWHDDIRDLETLPPGRREEAAWVRAQFGESAQHANYVTRGETLRAARTALAGFLTWHAHEYPGTAVASLGELLPNPADWDALPDRVKALDGFEPALRTALQRHGFEPDAFEPFFSEWRAWLALPHRSYDAMAMPFVRALSGPLALGIAASPEGAMFVTVAAHPPGKEPPRELATIGLDQLQSFNRLFSRYRQSALQLSSLGFVLLGLSVLWLYGIGRGIAVFAVPCGSCLFALGLLGLVGQTLNLFHLLGAFLGVCLSHNYAIFSAENAARGDEPPPSIRLSALTTGASFGVLAFSHIPVVAALGVTVAVIVMTALVAVELIPLAQRAPAPAIRT